MTMTVWKKVLEIEHEQVISFPKGAQFIHAREQNTQFCIWFLCNPNEKELEERHMVILGTGHTIDHDSLRYIGTGIFVNGSLVFHVFEKVDLYK